MMLSSQPHTAVGIAQEVANEAGESILCVRVGRAALNNLL